MKTQNKKSCKHKKKYKHNDKKHVRNRFTMKRKYKGGATENKNKSKVDPEVWETKTKVDGSPYYKNKKTGVVTDVKPVTESKPDSGVNTSTSEKIPPPSSTESKSNIASPGVKNNTTIQSPSTPSIQLNTSNPKMKDVLQVASGILSRSAMDLGMFGLNNTARLMGYIPKDSKGAQAIIESIGNQSENGKLGTEVMARLNNVTVCFLNGVSKVLEASEKSGNLDAAVDRIVCITSNILKKLNEKLNDPKFVKQLMTYTVISSDVASDIVTAAKPSLDNIIDDLTPIMIKLVTEMVNTFVQVSLNSLQALPGLDVFLGLVRDMTSTALAVSSIVHAGTSATSLFSNQFKNTIDNYKKVISEKANQTGKIKQSISDLKNTDVVGKMNESIPKVELPKVKVPEVNIPKVEIPTVNIPKVEIPTVNIPKVEIPTVNIPKVNVPTVKVPQVIAPKK